jgi:Zn-dependent peptidase ImmA (M78 family)
VLSGAVPVDEIAYGLGIGEIRREDVDGFEGLLLTDRVRSQGRILVNVRRGLQAARFSIAHELGHFLLERHELGLSGRFTCTTADLRETRTALQHQRQQAEANEFAIGLLVPEYLLTPYLQVQPDIRSSVDLQRKLDISREAATRCLVDHHDEPIAAVWTRGGKIRYALKGRTFPWIDRKAGDMVSSLSRTAQALANGIGTSYMMEVTPAAWTSAEIPELFEQVRLGKDGHTLTLLWATLPEASAQDDDD